MEQSAATPSCKRIIVLGSTGSIGVQTLEVIAHLNALHAVGEHPTRYEPVALAAGRDSRALCAQAQRWGVNELALNEEPGSMPGSHSVRYGTDAATRLVQEVECDLVVGAIVGIAGLPSVLRAVDLGIDVALANKESLVAAGSIVTQTAARTGARLLPLDSEHAGVWQCLAGIEQGDVYPPMHASAAVRRVVLTASGGAFGNKRRDQIEHASLNDALNHPNWDMGAKVTIDSATLMNKALELLEAHWLFGLDSSRLSAVIHPQSIVHAMVECADSSVIAQMGAPDMRAPIQHALSDKCRSQGCAGQLDVTKLGSLDFREIDPDRFPAIQLAMHAIDAGGDCGAALNAANEHCVKAFINGQIRFGLIDRVVASVMEQWEIAPADSIDAVLDADRRARALAEQCCNTTSQGVRHNG